MKLKLFKVEFNADNVNGNTVKSRFMRRVAGYFEFSTGWDMVKDFDNQLIINIQKKTDGANV